jgi:methyl-accepting chemotaxis protein
MTDANKHETSASSAAEPRDVMDTVKDKAKEVVAGAADVASAAKEKTKELVSTTRERVKEVSTATSELATHAKDKVQEWTVSAASTAGDTVQDLGKELTALVRRYPIPSLLVGVAVGFLLARATTRS